MTEVLRLNEVEFAYGDRTVLSMKSFQLNEGETCAVIGPSGCGKTTLLHLIAGLLRPQKGSVTVCGQRLDQLTASACDRFRGRHLGIVFQKLHLLPALSVLENLLLAQQLARRSRDAGAARNLLNALDVGHLATTLPNRLSQGQAQRVAIARALAHGPKLLLADEPTSSLDDGNTERAIDLLRDQAMALGASLLVVTHDQRIRGKLGREFNLERPT